MGALPQRATVETLSSSDRFRDMEASALAILDTDDRIPFVRRRGEFLYNFWRDAAIPPAASGGVRRWSRT